MGKEITQMEDLIIVLDQYPHLVRIVIENWGLGVEVKYYWKKPR